MDETIEQLKFGTPVNNSIETTIKIDIIMLNWHCFMWYFYSRVDLLRKT